MDRIDLPPSPRILVVALRRLGDVLLTTPLIRSIRRAWPEARIDVLVFADTAGIVDGNPDIDTVIAMPPRPSFGAAARIAARLLWRYDLAISTQSGDRPTIFTLLAGRHSAGVAYPVRGDVWKRFLLGRAVLAEPGVHRVEEMLRLADALGIARVAEVVAPRSPDMPARAPYAVIHPAPMFQYKRWTDAGWRALAEGLAARGLAVVATGGPGDRAYLDDVLGSAVSRVDGQLSWPQLASLLVGAQVYVGPDTSVTHLAAASGCPTVALFGPTDPRLWGPWPVGGLERGWESAAIVQRRGNVWLVQNPQPCLPCQNEGCDRHIGSHSRCLDELTPHQVLAAVDAALRTQAARAMPGNLDRTENSKD